MSKALEAAEMLSNLLHSLEKRGINLTKIEDRKWEKATALIEQSRAQIKNQKNCTEGRHEWENNPFKAFDTTLMCKHCGKTM